MEQKEMKGLPSSAPNSQLPEEIVLKILSLLPLELWTSFKSVSKRWNDFLPIEPFLERHFRSDTNPKLYLFADSYSYSDGNWKHLLLSFELPSNKVCNETKTSMKKSLLVPLPLKETHSVSNICHGLVCRNTHLGQDENFPVYLFSLRTRMAIPLRQAGRVSSGCRGSTTCRSISRFFLGFDEIRHEYRVLRIANVNHDTNCLSIWGVNPRNRMSSCEYEILSLGSSSNSWEPIENELVPPTVHQGRAFGESCCVDGVIYWLHYTRISRPYGEYIPALAAYDLRHGQFRVFEIDQKLVSFSSWKGIKSKLTSLKGSPTLLFFNQDDNNKITKLTMENHSSSNVSWSTSEIICPICVVYGVAGGIVLEQVRSYSSAAVKFKCYDLENGSTWDIESESVSGQTVLRTYVTAIVCD